MASTKSPAMNAMGSPWLVALASYWNMFCVGAVYSLSIIQLELPRILELDPKWSYALFAAACLGLSIGLGTCAFLLCRVGARSTASSGTLAWGLGLFSTGHFLKASSFRGIIASLIIGGVGVGWTYLSVIIMVGQSFPNRPLARSAIGPLGFSTGAGTCLFLRSYLRFDLMNEINLGNILQFGGYMSLLVGVVTLLGLPSDLAQFQPTRQPNQSPTDNKAVAMLYGLLFFNALPGMVAFSGLLPLTLSLQEHNTNALQILPFSMIALTLGGFFAQSLASFLGPRRTFALLFCLRGFLLMKFSESPVSIWAAVTLTVILFSHGTGFSLLPGLVKQLHPGPVEFASFYGQILVVWGLSGIGGAALCSLLTSSLAGIATLGQLIGIVTLFCGSILLVLPICTRYID